jgi:hypothetical protein
MLTPRLFAGENTFSCLSQPFEWFHDHRFVKQSDRAYAERQQRNSHLAAGVGNERLSGSRSDRETQHQLKSRITIRGQIRLCCIRLLVSLSRLP